MDKEGDETVHREAFTELETMVKAATSRVSIWSERGNKRPLARPWSSQRRQREGSTAEDSSRLGLGKELVGMVGACIPTCQEASDVAMIFQLSLQQE
ncbi:hypothetical protein HPP92_011115 [Vanilla planifolia]|uniref:Uncharacterized protein n=1 Tax=Vanilla planifolia TaxID=51239 RepID=A0A835R508_VANPL|nr:hypothetical protein HPP92_011115 [Vanilla planifolia]